MVDVKWCAGCSSEKCTCDPLAVSAVWYAAAIHTLELNEREVSSLTKRLTDAHELVRQSIHTVGLAKAALVKAAKS